MEEPYAYESTPLSENAHSVEIKPSLEGDAFLRSIPDKLCAPKFQKESSTTTQNPDDLLTIVADPIVMEPKVEIPSDSVDSFPVSAVSGITDDDAPDAYDELSVVSVQKHKQELAASDYESSEAGKHIDWCDPAPKMHAKIEREFQRYSTGVYQGNNYLRGCIWSPDGTCLLTNSCDNVFRIFEFPPALSPDRDTFDFENNPAKDELTAVLWMKEHELVYDYCWLPCMRSDDPGTCCFASTSRRSPVHLWDAFDGTLRATYLPFNHVGEMTSAQSIAFSADGKLLYCGFNRCIQVFHVEKPGCHSERRPRIGKKPDQGGIISTLTALPGDGDAFSRGLYAAGCFSGAVAVYAENNGGGRVTPLLQGPRLGVSQVRFAVPESGSTPWLLIAGGRADSEIYVWDSRWIRDRDPLAVLHRRVENYQRFQFDIDPTSRYLLTGSQTGAVSCFDLTSPTVAMETSTVGRRLPGMLPVSTWRAHEDSCHGLSIHPYLRVVATASGQKRLPRNHQEHRASSMTTMKKPRRLLCEECGHREAVSPPYPPPPPTAETSSSEDDSEDESKAIPLTDEEALATDATPLPMLGRLHRLPRRNEIKVWAFPQSEVVDDQCVHA